MSSMCKVFYIVCRSSPIHSMLESGLFVNAVVDPHYEHEPFVGKIIFQSQGWLADRAATRNIKSVFGQTIVNAVAESTNGYVGVGSIHSVNSDIRIELYREKSVEKGPEPEELPISQRVGNIIGRIRDLLGSVKAENKTVTVAVSSEYYEMLHKYAPSMDPTGLGLLLRIVYHEGETCKYFQVQSDPSLPTDKVMLHICGTSPVELETVGNVTFSDVPSGRTVEEHIGDVLSRIYTTRPSCLHYLHVTTRDTTYTGPVSYRMSAIDVRMVIQHDGCCSAPLAFEWKEYPKAHHTLHYDIGVIRDEDYSTKFRDAVLSLLMDIGKQAYPGERLHVVVCNNDYHLVKDITHVEVNDRIVRVDTTSDLVDSNTARVFFTIESRIITL